MQDEKTRLFEKLNKPKKPPAPKKPKERPNSSQGAGERPEDHTPRKRDAKAGEKGIMN